LKRKAVPSLILQDFEFEVLNPFGPSIGKIKLSDDLVNYLLIGLDKAEGDHGPHLAGVIENQPPFLKNTGEKVLKEIGSFIRGFYCQSLMLSFLGVFNVEGEREIELQNGWFVDQVAGEYNPRHHHPGCALSCVGYLEVPESVSDPNDRFCLDGCLEFSYGDFKSLSCNGFSVRPKVGDFYVFPGLLKHSVYPFKGEGRRKSFSMNMNVNLKK